MINQLSSLTNSFPISPITIALTIGFLFLYYKLAYKPKQYLKYLLSQGAVLDNLPPTNFDEFQGIKTAIKENPNMKAYVRTILGKNMIYFTDSNLIKDVLINHQNYYKLGASSELTQMLISRGVIVIDGQPWKLHRTVISEAFQYSFFNNMIPLIIKTTSEIINFDEKEPKTHLLPDTTELITSDVVTKLFFGVESANTVVYGRRAPEAMSEIMQKLMNYNVSKMRFLLGMWSLNIFSDYRQLKKLIRGFRKAFSDKIQARLSALNETEAKMKIGEKDESKNQFASQDTDLVEIMLRHRIKKGFNYDETLTDDEIIDDFFIFCVAGKDTTSLLVTMSLYCAEKYPEWGRKLKEEIEQFIKNPEEITLDLISSMPLLAAFQSEVLRMFPPLPVMLARAAKKDHYVGNFFVEKDTIVNVGILASNFNPKQFENPEEFNPTRWLKSEENKSSEGFKSNPFAYVPFSGGPRNCIGKHLALMEAKVIICVILKKYNVIIADPEFKLKMGRVGIGYNPIEPIPFRFSPKSI